MRKIYFDMSIEIHIFVMHSIFQERGNLPIVDRHFLCLVLSIRRFRTPVWSVNAPTAVEWCYATGQAEPFLFALILIPKDL